MPLQKAPRRRRRDKTTTIVLGGNPSVTATPCHFSLRLGHGAALICHRHIIHYRAATSLPLTQGSHLVGVPPLRYPLHRGAIWLVCRHFVTPYTGEALDWCDKNPLHGRGHTGDF